MSERERSSIKMLIWLSSKAKIVEQSSQVTYRVIDPAIEQWLRGRAIVPYLVACGIEEEEVTNSAVSLSLSSRLK